MNISQITKMVIMTYRYAAQYHQWRKNYPWQRKMQVLWAFTVVQMKEFGTTSLCDWYSTFWKLMVSSSGIKMYTSRMTFWPLEMRPLICLVTSGKDAVPHLRSMESTIQKYLVNCL
jgi:hypothetical protein